MSSPTLSALSLDDNMLPAMPNGINQGPIRRKANGATSDNENDTVSLAPTTTTTATNNNFVQDLIANTALSSASMKKERKDAPLNLLSTTPRNFTRFVARLGPVVDAFDAITEIMTWKDPSRTLVALLAYIILCIFPTLFMILPQFGLVVIITRNYYNKTKQEVTKKRSGGAYTTISTTSAQYLRNMQFIQNQMGMFATVHDEISANLRLIDWSSEEDTMQVLRVVVGSAVGVVVTLHLIPFNYIMLLAGLAAFSSNTALFRAASTTLPPVIMRNLQDKVTQLKDGILISSLSSGANSSKTSVNISTVQLYENQRWWAGLGWIPHLLRSERAAWSDETGSVTKPAKEEFELPSSDVGSWTWVDPDWRLDLGWAEVDEGGWRYTDHLWQIPKSKATLGSLTRRRCWVRDMKFTPHPLLQGAAKKLSAHSLGCDFVIAGKQLRKHLQKTPILNLNRLEPSSFNIRFDSTQQPNMRLLSLSPILLSAFLFTLQAPFQTNAMIDDESTIPMESFSLDPPYVQAAYTSIYEYLRLTPAAKSKQGWLWGKTPFSGSAWTVDFEFRVHGPNDNLFGDGFAFWITAEKESLGPVFGSKDYFTGLGLFFDTFNNGKHPFKFPYVTAMIGDGKTKYDLYSDGAVNSIGGCSADFRGKAYPTRARVKYIARTVLSVYVDVKNKNEWEECFTVENVTLPSLVYMGFSAHTGDATDNHDIIHVETKGIVNAKYNNAKPAYQNSANASKRPSSSSGGSWSAFFIVMALAIVVAAIIGGVVVLQKMRTKSYKRF
ncbi:hypothetical protein HDV05_005981 [Chytridiales sp. JEL 0842]|nr:hypothetical protein HDV05_005981 [Chytridiales sp. JEL 0842]